MEKKANAILLTPVDDVATTIIELHAGDAGKYLKGDELLEIVVAERVPQYHKFAVRDISQGGYVRKYGEVIGVATRDIQKGCHVHDHNIASPAAD